HKLSGLRSKNLRTLVINYREGGISWFGLAIARDAKEPELGIRRKCFVESFRIGDGFGLAAAPHCNQDEVSPKLIESMRVTSGVGDEKLLCVLRNGRR